MCKESNAGQPQYYACPEHKTSYDYEMSFVLIHGKLCFCFTWIKTRYEDFDTQNRSMIYHMKENGRIGYGVIGVVTVLAIP
ncbi:hypothetical protein D5086_024552 [Populus alba]|uniref:Uncharacterized protein n=1 Tax=Populus alba TaxID=43335 RepID=A0ACC4B7E6_POPAL